MKTIFTVIRWIIAILIILFSVATFMGKSYGQTICLLLVALFMVYWPSIIKLKTNNTIATFLNLK
jgi:small-conductance mechanosensitive channel